MLAFALVAFNDDPATRVATCLAMLLATACAPDAARRDASRGDASPSPEDRGQYLALGAAACAECHTPRFADGVLDVSRRFAGNATFADELPDDDARGAIPAPNLTPDATGLAGWTRDDVARAITEGRSRDGHALHPLMPYVTYGNARSEDVLAIADFLLGLDPIAHVIPPRQPLAVDPVEPAPRFPLSSVPDSTLPGDHHDRAAADRGRYLAAELGLCLFCHTEDVPLTQGGGLDAAHPLLGGRTFAPYPLGAIPAQPGLSIPSLNLTPHADGLAGRSLDDLVYVLLYGITLEGVPVCDPMPSGPGGAFGTLTEPDARDIATYLTTLPAATRGPRPDPCCGVCHTDGLPAADGGMARWVGCSRGR